MLYCIAGHATIEQLGDNVLGLLWHAALKRLGFRNQKRVSTVQGTFIVKATSNNVLSSSVVLCTYILYSYAHWNCLSIYSNLGNYNWNFGDFSFSMNITHKGIFVILPDPVINCYISMSIHWRDAGDQCSSLWNWILLLVLF